jgi:hypothetical protein
MNCLQGSGLIRPSGLKTVGKLRGEMRKGGPFALKALLHGIENPSSLPFYSY